MSYGMREGHRPRCPKSNSVHSVLPVWYSPFFAAIVRHVEMEAAKRGYFIIFCDSRDSTADDRVKGYRSALENAGIPVDEKLEAGARLDHRRPCDVGNGMNLLVKAEGTVAGLREAGPRSWTSAIAIALGINGSR